MFRALSWIAVLLAVACAGCQRRQETQFAAVLMQEDQFFRLVEKGMQAAADEGSVGLRVGHSRNRPEEELRLIDSYLVLGVKAIVISPMQAAGSAAALRRAADKGVVIVAFDTPLNADFVAASVESNQYDLGHSTGRECRRYIDEKLGGKARIATIGFATLIPESGGARLRGFREAVLEGGGVTIAGAQDAWLAKEANDVAAGMLTADEDLDILWAANEGGTVGAVTAASNAAKKRKKKLVVFGTDFSKQLANFLLAEDDILQAVTAQQPYEIGRRAVESAVAAVRGEKVEKKQSLPGALLLRQKPDEVQQFRERYEKLLR